MNIEDIKTEFKERDFEVTDAFWYDDLDSEDRTVHGSQLMDVWNFIESKLKGYEKSVNLKEAGFVSVEDSLEVSRIKEETAWDFSRWLEKNFKIDNLTLRGRWTMVRFPQYVSQYLNSIGKKQ